MAVETTKWGIIYCPKAGVTNKRKRWEKIQKVLDERGIAYDFVQSESSDSVERLMKMMINNGYKTIIIVGGDSALNDAVNCLMMEENEVRESIALGVIPNGVMNDFARFWEIDEDKIEETVDSLVKHRIRKVDLGCIRYSNANGERCHRYFLELHQHRYDGRYHEPAPTDASPLRITYPVVCVVSLCDALSPDGV